MWTGWWRILPKRMLATGCSVYGPINLRLVQKCFLLNYQLAMPISSCSTVLLHHKNTIFQQQSSHIHLTNNVKLPKLRHGLRTKIEQSLLDAKRSNVPSSVSAGWRNRINRSQSAANRATQKAKEMKENLFTIPNLLCMSRIAITPVLGYMVIMDYYSLAGGLFVVAGITDLMDGYIARNFKGQQSSFGSFLDPMADKFLVSVLFLTLTYNGLIPVALTGLIIARDVLLLLAGFYVRYISLPEPRTFSRYFNATMPTAQLHPTTISKYNTALQLALVWTTLGAPVFGYVDHQFLHYLWYATGAMTVVSGLSYVFVKETYKTLTGKSISGKLPKR